MHVVVIPQILYGVLMSEWDGLGKRKVGKVRLGKRKVELYEGGEDGLGRRIEERAEN